MLNLWGVNCIVAPAEINERILPGEPPRKSAERIAREKAETVGRKYPRGIILAADTIVVCDTGIMGKPRDEEDAFRIISCLSGKSHEVITSLCILDAAQNKSEVESEITRVFFRSLSPAEIRGYISSGEAMDKAGAYGIQGLGADFVERIDGCYYNVVGLPADKLFKMLGHYGIKAGRPPASPDIT